MKTLKCIVNFAYFDDMPEIDRRKMMKPGYREEIISGFIDEITEEIRAKCVDSLVPVAVIFRDEEDEL